MIELDSKFDVFVVSIVLSSVFLMSFTFLGIALNGEKVWREPNSVILYFELLIFSGSFFYLLYDIWHER
jgi:hypothetical protein